MQSEREKQMEQMLRRIEDNISRREAAFIYREVIARLLDYHESQLAALQKQICQEYMENGGQRPIEMCLCRSEEADYFAEGFTPLVSAGSSQAVWGSGALERIYIETGRRQITDVLAENNVFHAVVHTNYETYPARMTLRPVCEALAQAEQVNRLMDVNGWDMPPVNTIYLQGFYDVCFFDVLDRLRPDEHVETAETDFGELAPYVRRDVTLMWNIRKIQCKEQSFPKPLPQGGEVYYQHIIPLPHRQHAYLAELADTGRCSVLRAESSLVVKSPERQYAGWTLYELLDGRNACSRERPVLSNRMAEGIIGALQKKRQQLTAGEVYRCVHAYEAASIFDRIEVTEKGQLLFYPKDDNDYLNQDILDYILADMGRIFAGCRFTGKLVNGGAL